jgi:Tol biopolymer transport system component
MTRRLTLLAVLLGACKSVLAIPPVTEAPDAAERSVDAADGGSSPAAVDAETIGGSVPPDALPAVDGAGVPSPDGASSADAPSLLDASPDGPQAPTAGVLARISISADGTQSDGDSYEVTTSGDGNLVAFSSFATNLVFRDENMHSDIFLFRRSTGDLSRLSLAADNAETDADCDSPAISADGKTIVFRSAATNLIPNTLHPGREQIYSRTIGDFGLALRSRYNDEDARQPAVDAAGDVVAFVSLSGSFTFSDMNKLEDVYAAWGGRGMVDRISIGASAVEGNGVSDTPSVDAKGDVLAFVSAASNLVPADTNAASDVFVRGLQDKTLTRVSVSSQGEQANGASLGAVISGDGRRVAFCSSASNLVPDDTNKALDVFVYDLTTQHLERVSVSSAGGQGDGGSCDPSLSGDGRLVAFSSDASNLVADDVAFVGDTNYRDVFVHDTQTHLTVRISVPPGSHRANGGSNSPALSANGRVVAFVSDAPNLVPGDTNGHTDVFTYEFTSAPWF